MLARLVFAVVALIVTALPALAQSPCAAIANREVLTAAQWNSCFSSKQDTLGFSLQPTGANQVLRANSSGTSIGWGAIDLSKVGAVGTSILGPANGGFGVSAAGANGVPIFASGTPTFVATMGSGSVARATGSTFTSIAITSGVANFDATSTIGSSTTGGVFSGLLIYNGLGTANTESAALDFGRGLNPMGRVASGNVNSGTFADGYIDFSTRSVNVMTKWARLDNVGALTFQGGGKVSGLPTPTLDTDAARKKYVDDSITGITSLPAIAGSAGCVFISAPGVLSSTGAACGGTSGVTSFNSRSGAVTPTAGDYLSTQVNYTAPGTGGTVQTQARYNQNVLWAHDFGAVCDGVTNDAAAFQNLINEAIALKASARFSGQCKINSPLSITGTLDFGGTGQSISNAPIGTGAGSGLAVAANVNGINIDTQAPVYLHDFSLLAVTTTNAVGIQVDYSDGSCVTKCLNYGTVIERVEIVSFASNTHFIRAGVWRMDKVWSIGCTTDCVRIENVWHGDAGDNAITNSDFSADVTAGIGINWLSSGGLRFTGNKINGAFYGLCVCTISNEPTGVFNVANNSIENVTVSVRFKRDAGTAVLARMNFANNELFAGNGGYCAYAPTDAGGVWLVAVTFTGGTCTIQNGAVAGFSLDSIRGFLIGGGMVFESSSVGTPPRFALGSAATDGTIGPISYTGPGSYGTNALNGNRTATCSTACN